MEQNRRGIAAPTVWVPNQRNKTVDTLRDTRISLYSCADLGGTDGADDWMFRLTGQGEKYEPIGLHIYKSDMMRTHRVGTLLLSVQCGDRCINEWGNIDCLEAYADRVLLSTPYWGSADLGADIEILMLRPGCLRVAVRIENKSDAPLSLSLRSMFLASNMEIFDLAGGRQVDSEDWSIVFRTPCAEEGCTILPHQTQEISLLAAAASTAEKCNRILDEAEHVDLEDFRRKQAAQREAKAVDRLFKSSDRQLAHTVYNVIRTNVIQNGKTFFTAPNRVVHKGQWLWDSCFHAFAWSLFDQHRTAELLENLFAYQDEKTGFIPINIDQTHGINEYATQPPLIAFAIDKLITDKAIRHRLYPKLEKFYEWFKTNRQLSNGLYQWSSAGESGMDNSPRFDDQPGLASDESCLDFCSRKIECPVAHVDLSSMMALFTESLANLAGECGNNKRVEALNEERNELCAKINDFLFDDRDGFYYDRCTDGSWNRVKTVASFWTMTAGACNKHQAECLAEHLMNPNEFFTPMPIPSVAIDEPSFCFNYWRGPVWINTCFATILGLKRYGLNQQAQKIGRKVVDGIKSELNRSGQLWEIYDPLGGPASSMRKKYFGPRENAQCFAGWTANVLNIIKEINDI